MTKCQENKMEENKLDLLKFWSGRSGMLNKLWQGKEEEKYPDRSALGPRESICQVGCRILVSRLIGHHIEFVSDVAETDV